MKPWERLVDAGCLGCNAGETDQLGLTCRDFEGTYKVTKALYKRHC